MRKWGQWQETASTLVHRKVGASVVLAQVRDLADIPAAMEVAYHLHPLGPLDLIHLAAALIEIVEERRNAASLRQD